MLPICTHHVYWICKQVNISKTLLYSHSSTDTKLLTPSDAVYAGTHTGSSAYIFWTLSDDTWYVFNLWSIFIDFYLNLCVCCCFPHLGAACRFMSFSWYQNAGHVLVLIDSGRELRHKTRKQFVKRITAFMRYPQRAPTFTVRVFQGLIPRQVEI